MRFIDFVCALHGFLAVCIYVTWRWGQSGKGSLREQLAEPYSLHRSPRERFPQT